MHYHNAIQIASQMQFLDMDALDLCKYPLLQKEIYHDLYCLILGLSLKKASNTRNYVYLFLYLHSVYPGTPNVIMK